MAEIDTRGAILEAAMKRFLAHGITGTTMKQIQRDAGVSNGSLFHHFASKEALAGAVFADCVARYQRAFLDELDRHVETEAAVRAIVRMHLRWCVTHPQMARFLVTMIEPDVLQAAEHDLRELNDGFAVAVRGWWRPRAHHGTLRPLTPAQANALWLGPAQELVRAWLLGALPDPPGDADAEVLAEAAWMSLRAAKLRR